MINMETRDRKQVEIARPLIVEDQGDPLRLLEWVVKEVLPNASYDIARSYNSVRKMTNETKYGLVLLDHRMPIDDTAEPVAPTGVNVDYTEYFKQERAYSDCLRNIGYSLIPEIRRSNPSAVIVGTSSMKRELSDFPSPDFSLSKLNAKEDLEKILSEIRIGELKGGETK